MKRGAIEKHVVDEQSQETKKTRRMGELPEPPPGIKFEHAEEQHAIERAISGESMLITAGAGYGKSTLTEYLVEALRNLHGPKSVVKTAATGVAAFRLGPGGRTFHSFAGIGIGKPRGSDKLMEPREAVSKMKQSARQRWKDTRVLVIDEISMIDAEFMHLVSEVAQLVRKSYTIMGGLQVIMVGDFFQLPPVKGAFVFQLKYWNSWIGIPGTVLLKNPYRQSDAEYLHMLNCVKSGTLDDAAKTTFAKCAVPHEKREGYDPNETIVQLFPRRAQAAAVNSRALRALGNEIKTWDAVFEGAPYLKDKFDDLAVDNKFHAALGCRVMLVVNMDVEVGLVNGSVGQVVGFSEDGDEFPIVHFEGRSAPMKITPYEWKIEEDDNFVLASFKQLPLINANATTIHKSQGLTLRKVRTDVAGVFEPGMLYVVLSRTRNLGDLEITGAERINWSKVQPDRRVTQWYEGLTK